MTNCTTKLLLSLNRVFIDNHLKTFILMNQFITEKAIRQKIKNIIRALVTKDDDCKAKLVYIFNVDFARYYTDTIGFKIYKLETRETSKHFVRTYVSVDF